MRNSMMSADGAQPLLLPVDDAARYLGLSASYLNKLRVFGGGPSYHKLGRRVLYRRDDLEQWLGGHRFETTSEAEAA
jgi:excisionase family DNA binding protein